MFEKNLIQKLYHKFNEIDKEATIVIWAFGSNGLISGTYSQIEMAEDYCSKEELEYLKEHRFDLNNFEVRRILDLVFKKRNKSLKFAEEVWYKIYKVDYVIFREYIYKLFIYRKNIKKFMIETGIETETLSRLLTTLLNNDLITINDEYIIFKTPLVSEKREITNNKPINKRNLPDISFDQYFCTWKTCIKRVEKLINDMYLDDKKIIFIGDDDFTCIALSRNVDVEIHVFDLDEKVLNHINLISNEEGLNIKTHKGDLKDDLPSHLKNYFDIFLCDPTYIL